MAGFQNDILFCANVDFTGAALPVGQVTTNGQLLVGSSVSPNIRAYTPTGSNGLVVNTGNGTIDFTLSAIPNSALLNPSVNVTAGTGLSGGGNVGLGSSVTLNLSTPVTVSNGGSGVSTFANTSALVATGTTNTGALQNIASVATGQVLTSAGTSTLPAWSASPAVTSITLNGGTALGTYVEGTWTPTLTNSGTAPTVTYTAQGGGYTKIGNRVIVDCGLTLNTYVAGTGNTQISSLPFTINTSSTSPEGALMMNSVTAGTNVLYYVIKGITNATDTQPQGFRSGATALPLAAGGTAAGAIFTFTLAYQV